MVYFLNKIFKKFGYKIIKNDDIDNMIFDEAKKLLKQVEKMRQDKNSKMNANMIAVRNALKRLESANKKQTIANVAQEANVSRNTAKKYMHM